MPRLRNLLPTVATLAMPAIALAQEHGEAETVNTKPISNVAEGLATSITAVVVFMIVFAILAVKVWPVITKALDERAGKIKEEIESAELARKQAKDALDQYQKSLADARSEAQKMIEATRAQQATIASELKAKADVELAQMRERALKDIEAAKRAAVSEIYSHSTTLATAMASKILKRTINPGDTQQLVEESLAQLQAAARG
jgi:F-type H+-transporting ATPase subunit b